MKRGVLFVCLLFFFAMPIHATQTPFGTPQDYLPQEVIQTLPKETQTQILNGTEGTRLLLEKLWSAVGDIAPQVLTAFSYLLGTLLLFAALRAMPGMEKGIVSFVSTLCVCLECAKIICLLWQNTATVMRSLHTMMTAMLPVMSSLFLLGGNVSGAAVSASVLGLALSVMEYILASGFLPMLSLMMCLTVLSTVNGQLPVALLLAKIRSFFLFALGLFFSILLLILGYQSEIALARDSLGAKSLKLVASSAIPIVGGAVGDSVRVLLSGLSYLKRSVGGVAIVAICFLCAAPLLTLFCYRMLFGVMEVLCAWFSCQEEEKLFAQFGELLRFAIALLLGSLLFFFVILTLFSKSIAAYAS